MKGLLQAGALLGYITWKQPRLALTMAAAAAAVTAPYLGFAMAALNRWQVRPQPRIINAVHEPPAFISSLTWCRQQCF